MIDPMYLLWVEAGTVPVVVIVVLFVHCCSEIAAVGNYYLFLMIGVRRMRKMIVKHPMYEEKMRQAKQQKKTEDRMKSG